MKIAKNVGKSFAGMLIRVAAANVSTTSMFLLYQPTPPKKNK